MRFVILYLRSRRISRTLLTFGLTATVVWALTRLLVATSPYGVGSGGLTLLLIFGTFAVACVVGTSVCSPFGEAEIVAAHPLAPMRSGHLVVVLLWGTLLLSTALLSFDLEGAQPERPLLVLLRNLGGFSGLALVAAWMTDARISWIPPFVSAIAYLTLMGNGGNPLARWAMRSYDGNHGSSWTIALFLLVFGIGVVSRFGARGTSGERE